MGLFTKTTAEPTSGDHIDAAYNALSVAHASAEAGAQAAHVENQSHLAIAAQFGQAAVEAEQRKLEAQAIAAQVAGALK